MPATMPPMTISRTELYNQVWTTPMHRLAASYGISGNGLAKICDRLNIPYPPRGYWSKKQAGKKVIQYRLPEPGEDTPHQVTIGPTAPTLKAASLSPELKVKVDKIRSQTSEIPVADKLSRPHKIIARWLSQHNEDRKRARRERHDPFRIEFIDLTPLDDRRHRILDALFKTLEHQGARIAEADRAGLFAEIQGEKIEFQVRSKLKQIRRPLTADEKRWRLSGDKDWKQELEPTGYLVFNISTYIPDRVRKEWLETAEQPLESSLPEIVATFFIVAQALVAWHRKLAEEAEQRRLAEQRYVEAQRKKKKDENRWRRFVELAHKWRDYKLAEEFLEKLKQGHWDHGATLDGRTIDDWIRWAEERIRSGNPLLNGAEGVFSAIASTHEGSYSS